MKKINFKVKGMHCRSCEQLVNDALLESKGIKSAKASSVDEIVTVEYDEKLIDEIKIRKLIQSQGFKVV